MVHVRAKAISFFAALLAIGALSSCAIQLAVGTALVVTAPQTVFVTTNGKTETVTALLNVQWSDDPNWTDAIRTSINKKRPGLNDLIPVVSGGTLSGQVAQKALGAVPAETLDKNGIVVMPVPGSDEQRFSLVNQPAGDKSVISSGSFYVVMKVLPKGVSEYNVSFVSREGKALVASRGTKFHISMSDKVTARATSVPNFFSIDSLRKSALAPQILTGLQPNTKVVLATQDNKLVGETQVTVADASGLKQGQLRVIAPATDDLMLNAGGKPLRLTGPKSGSSSALQSDTSGDGSSNLIASVTPDQVYKISFAASLEKLRTFLPNPAKTLFVSFKGWNISEDATGNSADLFATSEILKDDGDPDDDTFHNTLRDWKVVLAVDGSGCIMCHGNVKANVVTKFGQGRSYYFGANYPGGQSAFSMYGDHDVNWADVSISDTDANGQPIQGKVIVPYVSAHSQVGFPTLGAYLRNRIRAPYTTPAVAAPKVTEVDIVNIGAPTKQDILIAAGTMPAAHPKWKYTETVSGDISGIGLSANGLYVTNTGPVTCNGGIVVDGVLHLKNLVLTTSSKGCQFYVTESFFLSGEVTYADSDPLHNLQVTSAKAAILGLGHDTLNSRFTGGLQHSFYTLDVEASTQPQLDAIMADAALIPDLIDAAQQTSAEYRFKGRAVSFTNVLINAPNFQSRYQGNFKGAIVARAALASLGAFSFSSSPELMNDSVPKLPLLPADVLKKILFIGKEVIDPPPPTPTPTGTPTVTSSPTPTIDPSPTPTFDPSPTPTTEVTPTTETMPTMEPSPTVTVTPVM